MTWGSDDDQDDDFAPRSSMLVSVSKVVEEGTEKEKGKQDAKEPKPKLKRKTADQQTHVQTKTHAQSWQGSRNPAFGADDEYRDFSAVTKKRKADMDARSVAACWRTKQGILDVQNKQGHLIALEQGGSSSKPELFEHQESGDSPKKKHVCPICMQNACETMEELELHIEDCVDWGKDTFDPHADAGAIVIPSSDDGDSRSGRYRRGFVFEPEITGERQSQELRMEMLCPICNAFQAKHWIELEVHADQCGLGSSHGKENRDPQGASRQTNTNGLDSELIAVLEAAGVAQYADRFAEHKVMTLSGVYASCHVDGDGFLRDRIGIQARGDRIRLAHEIQRIYSKVIQQDAQGKEEKPQPQQVKGDSKPLSSPPSKVLGKYKQMTLARNCQGGLALARPPEPKPKPMSMPSLKPSLKSKPKPSVHAWNDQPPITRQSDHMFCKRVPGTTFTVDSFKAKRGFCRQFFLSHFHYDHYIGLNAKFRDATVYCSEETARLVIQELRVNEQFVKPLPFFVPIDIEDQGIPDPTKQALAQAGDTIKRGATALLLDANHCPGSAMFLFKIWSTQQLVLHCGDCRFEKQVMGDQFKYLEVLRKHKPGSLGPARLCDARLELLFLDTTYWDPKYCFPLQSQVIQAVLAAARMEAFNPKTLFFVGSYSIGKERVFLQLADALSERIYVSARKLRLLSCLNLTDKQKSALTRNPEHARIHVVSMHQVSYDAMKQVLGRQRKYSVAVGFRPTGWTWSQLRGQRSLQTLATSSCSRKLAPLESILRRRQNGECIVYDAPYSEHSSYAELQEFIDMYKPRRVIPTVGNHEEIRGRL